MAKLTARTWWGISGVAAAILLLVGLVVGFVKFYHPLTLASQVNSHDVIAYVEWSSFSKLPIQSPMLAILQNQLGCSLEQCDFWGQENALLLRSNQGSVVPELYLYKADKDKLTEMWQHLADNHHELLLAGHVYKLYWHGEIAVIATQPVTLAKVSTIATMPWLQEAGISAWGARAGFGYCSLACADWLAGQLPTQSGSPMFSAFLQSTVRYIAFTLPEAKPLHLHYQIFFTDQYHHPLSSKRAERQAVLSKDTVIALSGDNFASKLSMLESNGQNIGLWQTVQSIWSNTATGQAWWNIAKGMSNYPYTLYWSKSYDQARLILDIPEEQKGAWRSQLEKNVAHYAAVLFPRQIPMTLPDGSVGAEYIKNTSLKTVWRTEAGIDTLVILDDANNAIFKLYLSSHPDQIELSLASPLRLTQATKKCFHSGTAVEEMTIWQVPTWPFVFWTTVEESSTQVVRGNVYFDNTEHTC